jgi:hypothetical protein
MTEKNIRVKYALIKDVVSYLGERHTTTELAARYQYSTSRVYAMMTMMAKAGVVIEKSQLRGCDMKYHACTTIEEIDALEDQAINDSGIVKKQETKRKEYKHRECHETPRRSEYWFVLTR